MRRPFAPALPLLAALSLARTPPAAAQSADPHAAPATPSTATPYVATGFDPAAVARIRADVAWLAAPERKGRRAGSAEGDAALAFVASRFRDLGLVPGAGPGGYRMPFEFVDGVDLGPKNALTTLPGGVSIGRRWEPGTDFRPLAFSAPGAAEGEVVFAGYGISAPDLSYDDYAGLDVKGKIVLVLRYGPDGDDPKSAFSPYLPLRLKATLAREKGARGVLFATGPGTKDVADDLVALRTDASFTDGGIPAISVKRALAEALAAAPGETLASRQNRIDETRKPASAELPKARVSFTVDVTPRRSKTANVVGLLPGADAARNKEFLVVGAHVDHLGLGDFGSLDASPAGKVHAGADDNASGVATLLELARTLAKARGKLARSVLFVAFGAEELGTLGSLHFTKSEAAPMDGVVAMVNLDMVGRLRDGKLEVHGVGTSPAWKPLVAEANGPLGLRLTFHEGGFGPSDHSPFYAAKKPVLFVFTGTHGDYHRPSDTAEKINAEGAATVAAFLTPILNRVASSPERIAFSAVAASAETSASASRGFRVWVGSIPDYSEEAAGVRLSGVSPGSPAEAAGLAGGDVIVRFGEKEIRNIYDYTYALQGRRPGEKVPVTVRRKEASGETLRTLVVTLGSRPSATK